MVRSREVEVRVLVRRGVYCVLLCGKVVEGGRRRGFYIRIVYSFVGAVVVFLFFWLLGLVRGKVREFFG